jgi:hypothetical protein
MLFTSGSTPETSGPITAWIDIATSQGPAWLIIGGIGIEGICVAGFGWAVPLWLLWRGNKLRPKKGGASQGMNTPPKDGAT